MKCDRRWYNDGRYARVCKAYEEWREIWTGVRTVRDASGRVVCMIGPPCYLFFEPGYDANGSPAP